MEGFVHVWKRVCPKVVTQSTLTDTSWDEFYPIRNILKLVKLDSVEQLAAYLSFQPSQMTNDQECLPFYCVTLTNGVMFIAHPNERERLQQLISGDLHPMRALVHELRYHPNIGLSVGPYKEHFERETKGGV